MFERLCGKFVVFDGGEGCGKSTQIALLRDAIASSGVEVLAVRDPGTTRIGEAIRAILLDPANTDMAMRCEMLLYMSARAQMMHQLIAPALERGAAVLGDRFVSSTLAYQLGGDGLDADEIAAVAQVALRGRLPDLTLILDMPVSRSSARLNRARDRIEQRPAEYHERVRANFLEQARRDTRRHRVIDADRAVESVHADVVAAVQSLP
jgi:dTMP kinase